MLRLNRCLPGHRMQECLLTDECAEFGETTELLFPLLPIPITYITSHYFSHFSRTLSCLVNFVHLSNDFRQLRYWTQMHNDEFQLRMRIDKNLMIMILI